jgi:hypothetical protein
MKDDVVGAIVRMVAILMLMILAIFFVAGCATAPTREVMRTVEVKIPVPVPCAGLVPPAILPDTAATLQARP